MDTKYLTHLVELNTARYNADPVKVRLTCGTLVEGRVGPFQPGADAKYEAGLDAHEVDEGLLVFIGDTLVRLVDVERVVV